MLFTAFFALAPVPQVLVGAMELLTAVTVFAASVPFTLSAWRGRRLNLRRAGVYHRGLLLTAAAGLLRALSVLPGPMGALLAAGVLLLLGVAVSNSWQLVISHRSAVRDG